MTLSGYVGLEKIGLIPIRDEKIGSGQAARMPTPGLKLRKKSYLRKFKNSNLCLSVKIKLE